MYIFDYDSTFSEMLRRCAGCILLGGLWLVCCVLVVTAGAGSAAVYYAVEKHIIRQEETLIGCFWQGFRESFGTATLTLLPLLAAGWLLSWDTYYFYRLLLQGSTFGMLCVAAALALVLLLLTATWAFAYIARFRDGVWAVLKNAFLLMLTHPLVNLKILFVWLTVLLCALFKPVLLILLPGFGCWLVCRSTEKVFARLIERKM